MKTNNGNRAEIQTSVSALGPLATIFSFQAFGSGKQKQFVDKECFLDFLLLMWLDLSFSRKPVKCKACVHANFSYVSNFNQLYEKKNVMSWFWRCYLNLNDIIQGYVTRKNVS